MNTKVIPYQEQGKLLLQRYDDLIRRTERLAKIEHCEVEMMKLDILINFGQGWDFDYDKDKKNKEKYREVERIRNKLIEEIISDK